MKRFSVTVAYSILQTIEVDAQDSEEAAELAFYQFDMEKSVLGEGEVLETKEINPVHPTEKLV